MRKLCAVLAVCMLLWSCTGCAYFDAHLNKEDASEQRINVYTCRDYEPEGCVAQLDTNDHVELVLDILANTEPAPAVPDRSPDYILHLLPEQGTNGGTHWWFWTDPPRPLTLLNQTESPEEALLATTHTSHDFGELIEELSGGQAMCC